jgi:hypothetical protein
MTGGVDGRSTGATVIIVGATVIIVDATVIIVDATVIAVDASDDTHWEAVRT